MCTPDADNTMIGIYNIYDSLCLMRAFNIRNIPNKIMSKIEHYNAPLSMILYKTSGGCLKNVLKALLYDAGLLFSFSDI